MTAAIAVGNDDLGMPACIDDPLFKRVVVPASIARPVADLAGRWGDPPPAPIGAVLFPREDARIDLRAIEHVALALESRVRGHEEIAAYLGAARAESTYAVYDTALTAYVRQCAAWDAPAVPVRADILLRYLSARADAGYAFDAVRRTIVAINALHAALGLDAHAVTGAWLTRQLIRGIANERGRLPERQARALLPEYVERALPFYAEMAKREPVRAARNVSILTLAVATAGRGSSLRGLETDDIEIHPEGMRVTFRVNKTRQTAGDVHVVDVHAVPDSPICPVKAVITYAKVARLERGPLFRGLWADGTFRPNALSVDQMSKVVKECVAAIGLPEAEFSSHSMRVGMVTAGYEAGLGSPAIMQVSDHHLETTMLNYIRPETPFKVNHTAAIFGTRLTA